MSRPINYPYPMPESAKRPRHPAREIFLLYRPTSIWDTLWRVLVLTPVAIAALITVLSTVMILIGAIGNDRPWDIIPVLVMNLVLGTAVLSLYLTIAWGLRRLMLGIRNDIRDQRQARKDAEREAERAQRRRMHGNVSAAAWESHSEQIFEQRSQRDDYWD